MPKGYQSFLQKSTRITFCSKEKLANHDLSAAWVASALSHFKIEASDTKDYKYPLDRQPARARIWPE
ncbi:hypothetical protein HX867_01295 [Pseudomonas gingeri]|uniref:hypothetical protein n=1 Tax=Pseudomonas gingeri TaxID=117681 RepID=UPI0015A02ED3|nr:hypothetical protein [Pseudomonas gingeri]NVZ60708.1 hypothetical protein [Pseudomonas gingeri]NVZ76190.1 hypothetical protein [Pseudomonas gingeri]